MGLLDKKKKKEAPAAQPPAAQPPAQTAYAGIPGDSYAPTHSASLVKTPLGFGLDLTMDNVITGVTKGSQAERSGQFQLGDKVTLLNGLPLKPRVTVTKELQKFSAGATVTFGLQRGGAPKPATPAAIPMGNVLPSGAASRAPPLL